MAKLGDFGLAVALDRSRLTQVGMMVGTVSYMAPEQALGGEVTGRSDLYSLGCVLYELVTGRPPFIGDESVAIISQHLNTPPVAPSWHTPDLPSGLEALILRLLEKDPAKRPASATEVHAALASVAAAPSPPVPTPPGTRAGLAASSAGQGKAYPPPAAGEGEGEGASPSTPYTDPTYRRTFVGREAELTQLQRAFDAALSGQGSLAMVVGEPGIGKTSICEQLATYVAVRGGRALVGHCYEEGSLSLPYLPFVEAMRTYVLAREPGDLEKELGSGASEVARIVSEVRDKLQVSPSEGGDPDEQRWRLLQAVTGFLRNASSVQPLLIVLEDLHDADKGTLDLLLHLSRNLQGARLMIVGTYRDVEVDRTHALSGTLAELRRAARFLRVPLRGLTVDEVQRMISNIRGQEVSWSRAELYHRQTEGNPLFVQEVLRYLVEEGLVVREAGRYALADPNDAEAGIPEGLRDVIGKRLSRLSEKTNQVLSIASVMGRDFRLDVLQTVSAQPEEELFAALQEAEDRAVIEERPAVGGVPAFRFTHAFFRQTLYEEIFFARRIRWHQQVARALEAVHARRLEEHAAELAEHFAYSSDPADLAKAVEYGQLAAQRAMSVYAYGEAVRHLENALKAQDVLDPDDAPTRCDLLLALGEALMPAGEPQRVFEDVAEGAFALAELVQDRNRASRACQQALMALVRYGSSGMFGTAAGRTWTERADAHAEPSTLQRVYADVALSSVHRVAGRYEAASVPLAHGLEVARGLGDGEAFFRAATIAMLSFPEFGVSEVALVREVGDRPRLGANPRMLANCLMICAEHLIAQGDRAGTDHLWNEIRELAARTQDAAAMLCPFVADITSGLLDGRIELAVESLAGLIAHGDELGSPASARAWGLGPAGGARALMHLGRAAEALAVQDEQAEATGEDAQLAGVQLWRIRFLASLGRPDEAGRLWRELLADALLGPDDPYAPINPRLALLEAAVALEDRGLLTQIVPRLAGLSQLPTYFQFHSTPARHLGAGAALLDEAEQARAYYQQALEAAGRISFRPEIALTRLQLAELLLQHYPDEGAEASDHLDFAIQEFEAMKMAPSLERARALRARF